MAVGSDETWQLYWHDHHIGSILQPRWSDFPWIAGRFTPAEIPAEARALLEWESAQSEMDDDLAEPPFRAELWDGWYLLDPDHKRWSLAAPPRVDFAGGWAEWRYQPPDGEI
jgi:hypothetical protein